MVKLSDLDVVFNVDKSGGLNALIVILVFAAWLFVMIGYIRRKGTCSKPVTEYRYVPRTFVEEQEDPSPVSDIFDDMFLQNTPWEQGHLLTAVSRRNNVNNSFFNTEPRRNINAVV